ncbi:hypothetical protein J2T11_004235, partial [Paenarthrobacter nicotinovorans]|nr:hypothetical protein [Paenarthrobacter nicotinovorans]
TPVVSVAPNPPLVNPLQLLVYPLPPNPRGGGGAAPPPPTPPSWLAC